MDALKIRCSALGKIMGSAGKALPVGAKTYCRELFIEQKYGRVKEVSSKYLDRGTISEQDAIDMYNRVHGTSYVKNEKKYENDWIVGTPDIISDVIRDVKCPWDIFTYIETKQKLLAERYWQVLGYEALTGIKIGFVDQILVNMPAEILSSEAKNLWYSHKCPEQGGFGYEKYERELMKLERRYVYDSFAFATDYPHYDLVTTDGTFDIPEDERVHTFEVPYEQERIEQIYERIEQCRKYINTLSL